MSETFQKKCDVIKNIFSPLANGERYQVLIEMGRKLPPYPESNKTPVHIVSGCQSTLYLSATLRDDKIYFEASADALISAGLAALLISVYSGESPETVLTQAPNFISELGLAQNLSLNRSNGLANICLKMKKEALAAIVKSSRK